MYDALDGPLAAGRTDVLSVCVTYPSSGTSLMVAVRVETAFARPSTHPDQIFAPGRALTPDAPDQTAEIPVKGRTAPRRCDRGSTLPPRARMIRPLGRGPRRRVTLRMLITSTDLETGGAERDRTVGLLNAISVKGLAPLAAQAFVARSGAPRARNACEGAAQRPR